MPVKLFGFGPGLGSENTSKTQRSITQRTAKHRNAEHMQEQENTAFCCVLRSLRSALTRPAFTCVHGRKRVQISSENTTPEHLCSRVLCVRCVLRSAAFKVVKQPRIILRTPPQNTGVLVFSALTAFCVLRSAAFTVEKDTRFILRTPSQNTGVLAFSAFCCVLRTAAFCVLLRSALPAFCVACVLWCLCSAAFCVHILDCAQSEPNARPM